MDGRSLHDKLDLLIDHVLTMSKAQNTLQDAIITLQQSAGKLVEIEIRREKLRLDALNVGQGKELN